MRHQLMARVVPRLRKAGELDDEPTERARVERWHEGLDRSLPTGSTPRFARRFSVVTEQLPGGFPAYSIVRRGTRADPDRPLPARWRLHGADQRLAGALRRAAGRRPRRPRRDARLPAGARAHLARLPRRPGRAGGAARDRGRAGPRRRLLGRRARARPRGVAARPRRPPATAAAPDLTLGRPDHLTPDTAALDAIDPWLFLGKVHAYAGGGPARPTTWAVRRSAPGWAT